MPVVSAHACAIPVTPRPHPPTVPADDPATAAPGGIPTGWRCRLKGALVDNAGRAWCPYWLVTAAFWLFRLKVV